MNPALLGAAIVRYLPSTTNVVLDGNSLVAGTGSSVPAYNLAGQVASLPPISGQLSITNLGIGGQTTRQMNGMDGGSSADVDAAWVSGKTNVLLVWEGTNSIYGGGRTASQAYQDMADYCAARLALNPWLIVIINTLPRQIGNPVAEDAMNAKLVDYNAQLAAGYRSMGARAVVDVRQAGSPFAFTNYSQASYDATVDYWKNPEYIKVHLSDTGYSVIAGYVASQLKRLRLRG